MTCTYSPPSIPRTPPTREQERTLAAILAGLRRGRSIHRLGGYAGTGKTTLIRHLKEQLPGYAVCAFTGKAASVLRRKGLDAGTIHSLIYEPKEDPFTGAVSFLPRDFLPHAGIIVDEASMVGRDLYRDLLRFRLPVIFVGDHGQLEPVGSDFNLMAEPDHRLETIHRNAGEISRFAEWLRMGRDAIGFPLEATGQVEFLGRREVEGRGLWADVDQVVCAYNRTRVGVNAMVRRKLGRGEALVAEGERVMCLRNNREKLVYNGQQGVVLEYRRGRGRHAIDFESHGQVYRDVPIDPGQFGLEGTLPGGRKADPLPFDYAYAITCHKAQGDEFGTVLVLEQKCSRWEHSRWAYTAASRARDKVYWVRGF